jgi:hypothetical protein
VQFVGVLHQPRWCPYFWDPIPCCKYASSPLKQLDKATEQTPRVGYALGAVYCHMFGEEQAGLHSSIVDVQTQAKIIRTEFEGKTLLHEANRPKGIVLLSEVYRAKREAAAKLAAEARYPLHAGWVEDKPGDGAVPPSMDYDRAAGGPKHGPTSDGADWKGDLPTLFFKFLPMEGEHSLSRSSGRGTEPGWRFSGELSCATIATECNRYANEDWVKPVKYGQRKRPVLMACGEADAGARHRYKGQRRSDDWKDITAQSVLVFLAILIAMAAMDVRTADVLWSAEYNTSIAWIQNAMTKRAFLRHRSYLHFTDNGSLAKSGSALFDRLGKVRCVVCHYSAAFKRNWTIGMRVAVDEAMIRYKGHAINWSQYMPAKPIKHGIKVFCACCAETGYLFSFEVYTGAMRGVDGSAIGVIGRLFAGCDFEATHAGRVLYTDNFYTSIALMAFLYVTYNMYLIGTVRMHKNKPKDTSVFPFHKLPSAALKKLERGWMRRAVKTVSTLQESGPQSMEVEATVWKDRKQVGILRNYKVSPRYEESVPRRVRGQSERALIAAHAAVVMYNDYMGAVDRNDRDTADWGITMRTARWYLHIFIWLLNGQLANMWYITCATVDADSKYLKQGGRYRWQLDLAQALIAYALDEAWGDTEVERTSIPRPWWTRQDSFVPCNCRTCWHCKQGLTKGVQHPVCWVSAPFWRCAELPAIQFQLCHAWSRA